MEYLLCLDISRKIAMLEGARDFESTHLDLCFLNFCDEPKRGGKPQAGL